MPGGLAERAVIAALHQGEPAGWVVADRGDLLVSPGRCRNPRLHTNRIAHSSSGASVDGNALAGIQSARGAKNEGVGAVRLAFAPRRMAGMDIVAGSR